MRRRRFAACGLVLESSLPLPLLPAAPGSGPVLRLEAARPSRAAPPGGPLEPFLARPGGRPAASLARTGEGVLLRFHGVVDVVVPRGAGPVRCVPVPGTDRRALAVLLADTAVPALAALRGGLVLHGSAVRFPGGAAVLVGPAGAGKSSLAAAFAGRGFPVLADDAVALRRGRRGWEVHPAAPALRVDARTRRQVLGDPSAAGRGKTRLPLRGRSRPGDARPVPLLAILVLRRGGRGRFDLRRMAGPRAVAAVVDTMRVIDRTDRSGIRAGFEAAADLVEAGRVAELRIPRWG